MQYLIRTWRKEIIGRNKVVELILQSGDTLTIRSVTGYNNTLDQPRQWQRCFGRDISCAYSIDMAKQLPTSTSPKGGVIPLATPSHLAANTVISNNDPL